MQPHVYLETYLGIGCTELSHQVPGKPRGLLFLSQPAFPEDHQAENQQWVTQKSLPYPLSPIPVEGSQKLTGKVAGMSRESYSTEKFRSPGSEKLRLATLITGPQTAG